MRCSLRVSPRLPVQVETSIPEQNHHQQQTTPPLNQSNEKQHNQQQQQDSDSQQQQQQNLPPNNILPGSACIINGAGASRVFQILYRNEEVTLRDVVLFRTHLLGKQNTFKYSIKIYKLHPVLSVVLLIGTTDPICQKFI